MIIQCQPIFDIIREKNGATEKAIEGAEGSAIETTENNTLQDYDKRKELDAEEKSQGENEEKLIALLEQRLQYLLRSLTKLCLSKNSETDKTSIVRSCQKSENLTNLYKQCYSLTLKNCTLVGHDFLDHMSLVLQEIERKIKESTKSY